MSLTILLCAKALESYWNLSNSMDLSYQNENVCAVTYPSGLHGSILLKLLWNCSWLCACSKEMSSHCYVLNINRLVKSEILRSSAKDLHHWVCHLLPAIRVSLAHLHCIPLASHPALWSVPPMGVTVVLPPSHNQVLSHMNEEDSSKICRNGSWCVGGVAYRGWSRWWSQPLLVSAVMLVILR